MTAAVYLAIYFGLFIFLAGCLRRILVYARTPLHLRWEIYPLPHEHPYRAAYGGSYFETQEWWRQPQVTNRRGEWRVMIEEILFLKSLREYNRRLWLPSFLFHFGLYIAIAAVACAALALACGQLSATSQITGLVHVLAPIAMFSAAIAATLIVAGAFWLLMRRTADPALKNSTHAGDIFNLLFFIVAFTLLIGGYMLRAPGTATLGEFARGAVHFDRSITMGSAFGAGLILASTLLAYIPFTHMAHFIAKYFTWHAVRWDDRRNERGSVLEDKVAASLGYKPTWSAPHVGADGQRTWAEIATTNPTREAQTTREAQK
ncbi:MAG: respiratory nitrate reductase subunit gamma [Terracidiphilus sp.]|nr:respiratory nitrate reductase subunit gamma [Terracidiphilus sp.]MDR3796947.1 respiratory nitrate reductase subunit gamma [Terracidiphilus sp.]